MYFVMENNKYWVVVAPLIENLNFIKNKHNWGYIFRFGFLEIPQADLELISNLMLFNTQT
jgi:predicted RNA-binding protein